MRSVTTPTAGRQQLVDLGHGRKASLEIVGTGPPMFWFEGGPGLPARLSRADAELLSGSFAVHLIDPHGSGASTPPSDPSQYDHFGHARFYDEVRRALGLERVTIAGISFGGTVALTYASMFPESTVQCLAVSAFGVGTQVDDGQAAAEMERMLSRHAGAPWYAEARRVWDGWTDAVLEAQDSAQVDRMLATVLPFYFAHPDQADVHASIEWLQAEIRSDLAAMKSWEGGLYQTIDLRPLLANIICPTLVIAGELDLIGGPAQAGRIAASVPGAELVIVADCGHFVPAEAPEIFRSAVLEWSRSMPKPG